MFPCPFSLSEVFSELDAMMTVTIKWCHKNVVNIQTGKSGMAANFFRIIHAENVTLRRRKSGQIHNFLH